MEIAVVLLLVKICFVYGFTWTYDDWVTQVWKQWGNNKFLFSGKFKCDAEEIRDKKSGIIQSPNYPLHYPNNANCKWTIQAPKAFTEINFNLIKFSVDNPKWSKLCFKDYVEIYQYPEGKRQKKGKYCGKRSGQNITIYGNKAEIIFKSNSYRTRKGFKINWQARKGCGGNQFGIYGQLAIPKSKGSSKHFFCEWRIKAPQKHNQIDFMINSLKFARNYSSCRRGRLVVFDGHDQKVGEYCDSSVPQVIRVSGREMRIQIRMAKKSKHDDFHAKWLSSKQKKTEITCGIPTVEHHRSRRVVGGSIAQEGSWPWIAQVRTTIIAANFRSRISTCGGVIISPWYVLTAAHCVANKHQIVKIEILVGTVTEYITEQKLFTVSSKEISSHPRFKWKGHGRPENDIALIKLPERLKFGYKIQPICLPDKNKVNLYQKNCEFGGWGKTAPTSPHSEHLNIVKAHLGGHCSKNKSILCVSYNAGNSGACKGDSGSPLICKREDGRRYLTGILSFGAKTCPSTVDGHMHIPYYMDWITNVMRKGCHTVTDNS